MKKPTSPPPAKSAAASTSRPRRGSEEQAGALWYLGPHGTVIRTWDLMRDLIGPAWKESGVGAIEGEQTTLADFVFQALYVKRKRQYPKASEENREKNLGVEVTCHEVLSGWIAEALNKKDVGFFARLTEAMAALKKVFPSGINGEMEPDDKWRWTAAWFIWKYWNKHGCAPRQQAVREHLESMEHYHGQPTPQTGPLPKKTWTKERRREGSFQHVDRKGGPPKKPVR